MNRILTGAYVVGMLAGVGLIGYSVLCLIFSLTLDIWAPVFVVTLGCILLASLLIFIAALIYEELK